MNSDLKVSIVTPTYNHGKYIGKCIESVLAQTYPHWEMIIIDDGSTDNTGDVIDMYVDDRILYVKQENQGIYNLSKTYNRALEISSGELVAVLEGDDFWPPCKLMEQIKAFQDESVALSWGKTCIVNEDDQLLKVYPQNDNLFSMSHWDLVRELMACNYIPACTVMCRKEALLSIGGFLQGDDMPFVDYPTWLNLSLKGRFYAIDSVLGFWRWHDKQVTKLMKVEMSKATSCTKEFYDKLPLDIKSELKLSCKAINRTYQKRVLMAYIVTVKITLSKYVHKVISRCR